MGLHPKRGAALALLALSAGYVVLALRLEDAARAPIFVLGPRSFPLFVGAAGIVLSIVLLLLREPSSGGNLGGDWRPTLALCAFMLLYAGALPRAGFTLSTAVFLGASFRLLGERRPVALTAVPIGVALAVLALLRGAFGAHLPEPLLERLLNW